MKSAGAVSHPLEWFVRRLFDPFSGPLVIVIFPHLHILRNKVRFCSNVVLSKGFASFFTEISEDKENLPKTRRTCMEEKHCLVPRGHFRAWDISSFGPRVSLAFNNDFLIIVSKVEFVWFPSIDSDFNCYARSQMQAVLSKKIHSLCLKITTDLGIAFCSFTLEWPTHVLGFQRTTTAVYAFNRCHKTVIAQRISWRSSRESSQSRRI